MYMVGVKHIRNITNDQRASLQIIAKTSRWLNAQKNIRMRSMRMQKGIGRTSQESTKLTMVFRLRLFERRKR